MYWEYNGMQSDVMGIFIMGCNGHIIGSIQWDVMGSGIVYVTGCTTNKMISGLVQKRGVVKNGME
jgi:hypothetical protein